MGAFRSTLHPIETQYFGIICSNKMTQVADILKVSGVSPVLDGARAFRDLGESEG